MASFQDSIAVKTKGLNDILDITSEAQEITGRSGIVNGIACVAVPGSTAAITTIEYEEGVLRDLHETLERLVPSNKRYHHDARWGDGNGYAHVRSALVGTSQSFPVQDRQLVLGTWQQIVLIDFDNRPRQRRVLVQVVGE